MRPKRSTCSTRARAGSGIGTSTCFVSNASDGKIVAMGNPNLKQALGTDVRAAQNSTGRAFGVEVYAAMQKPEELEFTEVGYMMPKLRAPMIPTVAKASLIEARADSDLGCGVGYYKGD